MAEYTRRAGKETWGGERVWGGERDRSGQQTVYVSFGGREERERDGQGSGNRMMVRSTRVGGGGVESFVQETG